MQINRIFTKLRQLKLGGPVIILCRILTAKLSPYYFTYLLLNLRLKLYNRTITRFIADDKVVYQRVRRKMRLASYNS